MRKKSLEKEQAENEKLELKSREMEEVIWQQSSLTAS